MWILALIIAENTRDAPRHAVEGELLPPLPISYHPRVFISYKWQLLDCINLWFLCNQSLQVDSIIWIIQQACIDDGLPVSVLFLLLSFSVKVDNFVPRLANVETKIDTIIDRRISVLWVNVHITVSNNQFGFLMRHLSEHFSYWDMLEWRLETHQHPPVQCTQ